MRQDGQDFLKDNLKGNGVGAREREPLEYGEMSDIHEEGERRDGQVVTVSDYIAYPGNFWPD